MYMAKADAANLGITLRITGAQPKIARIFHTYSTPLLSPPCFVFVLAGQGLEAFYSSGCSQIGNPPASALGVMGLQARTITLLAFL